MYGLTAFERDPFFLLDPFSDFDDRFVSKETVRSFKTDIREEDDKFIMEAELPGFEKGEIQLDVNGDTLTLSAVHQQEQVDKSKEHYICRERSYGSYQRRFDISGIDADQIEAEYKRHSLYGSAEKTAKSTSKQTAGNSITVRRFLPYDCCKRFYGHLHTRPPKCFVIPFL